MKLQDLAQALRNAWFHQTGRCPLCGHATVFVCLDVATARNNMVCVRCHSSSRQRHIAQVLLRHFGAASSSLRSLVQGRGLRVYSTDSDDAMARLLRDCPTFCCSEYEPDVPLGQALGPHATCQDVQRLTYPDACFDVVVSSDVFEHVRQYKKGFAEVHRVLRPGGLHVFTVPFYFDRSTVVRIDTQGSDDVTLLSPPEYHTDRLGRPVLTYRSFGVDLCDELRRMGFSVAIDFSRLADQRLGLFDSQVFVTQRLA